MSGRRWKRIKHSLIDSLKNLKRNGWMSIVAIGSITLMLGLGGLFTTAILNTQKIASDIENNVKITVYMDVDNYDNDKTITEDDVQGKKKVPNENYHKIYDEIGNISEVKNIEYSSKDDQLKQLVKAMGKEWAVFDGDSNPLYNVYVVEVNHPRNIKKVSKQINKIKGIAKVDYGGKTSNNIFEFSKKVKAWGTVGILALIGVAVFLIANTIRLTIISRSEEIKIQRLVGSKNNYIRAPFVLEGVWFGVLGAIIPSILVGWLYGSFYRGYNYVLIGQNISMYTPGGFIFAMTLILFVFGALIGAIGSVVSMRKYLKV